MDYDDAYIRDCEGYEVEEASMVKPKDARRAPHTARDSKGRFVKVGAKSVDCCSRCYNALKDQCVFDYYDCECHVVVSDGARAIDEHRRRTEWSSNLAVWPRD